LDFSFGSDFMGETIGEARPSCQQAYTLPNTLFTTFARRWHACGYPVSREHRPSLEGSLLARSVGNSMSAFMESIEG
jgi:hypothetical protein